MGLFSFLKGKGKKPTPAQLEAEKALAAAKNEADIIAANGRIAAEISRDVMALGLKVDNFNLKVKDGTATISGTVPDQSTKEKVVLAVGNNVGIATVDDHLYVAVQEPEAEFYTVESGDTLGKIAKKYYGDAMKYPVIFEANKPMLADPDKIYVGQTLRIPPQA
ncbi:peptidoglycan-binding protein LysM [Pararhodonellum marinum]|uniref:peptidoglycan-binding protein LysM n=1 Tax=Pararhodonellum marinum TaxID=2755358 RepID=UPI00188FDC80|nr:peptidoglycan-binding protein LysM [Pararhodonellum marinum]